jgi:putative ABC transport system substrate-binding protein
VALQELQRAAQLLGLQLQSVAVEGPKGFEEAFGAMARGQVDGLLVFADPLTFVQQDLIVAFAGKSRIAALFGAKEFVDAGGLMSYGSSYPGMFRREPYYVDRILKGAKPGDLPIKQPTKFELVVNLKTAKALGLTIPQSVLNRTDEVIR